MSGITLETDDERARHETSGQAPNRPGFAVEVLSSTYSVSVGDGLLSILRDDDEREDPLYREVDGLSGVFRCEYDGHLGPYVMFRAKDPASAAVAVTVIEGRLAELGCGPKHQIEAPVTDGDTTPGQAPDRPGCAEDIERWGKWWIYGDDVVRVEARKRQPDAPILLVSSLSGLLNVPLRQLEGQWGGPCTRGAGDTVEAIDMANLKSQAALAVALVERMGYTDEGDPVEFLGDLLDELGRLEDETATRGAPRARPADRLNLLAEARAELAQVKDELKAAGVDLAKMATAMLDAGQGCVTGDTFRGGDHVELAEGVRDSAIALYRRVADIYGDDIEGMGGAYGDALDVIGAALADLAVAYKGLGAASFDDGIDEAVESLATAVAGSRRQRDAALTELAALRERVEGIADSLEDARDGARNINTPRSHIRASVYDDVHDDLRAALKGDAKEGE